MLPLLRQLLHVVAGKRIVWNHQRARKPIDAIPNRNVERLPEDAVPVRRVRDDLRVSARHIQHDRVLGARDASSHLDVADAVVHAHEGLAPEERAGSRGEGNALEGRAHPRAFGVAYAVDVGDLDARLADGLLDEADDPRAVVQGGFFGEEAFAWRGIVGVPEVGEYGWRF